mmetsp:Transcript_20635/g.41944  ORF Transcript_20635/g.41944 Transcript_20635/m.41944 type:complete len:288 (-) Transcript_20635:182-1045(-)
MRRSSTVLPLLLLLAPQRSDELMLGMRVRSPATNNIVMMGRKFENNKLKMAKTALAYAKKASYIGKKVVIAVKAGGDDPSINRQLAAVMSEANALNVPKDVVNKNIKRAMDTDTANYDELTYEGYGHGGVGLIINCLSDNKNRAVEQVGTALKKEGCKVAASGSVAFNFARKARLAINAELDEEQLLELAIEAECEGDVSLEMPDPEGRGDGEEVKCVAIAEVAEMGLLQAALQEAGHASSGQLVNIPMTLIGCSDEDMEANYKAIDRLEEIDDVSSVEHNMEVAAS